MASLSSIVVDVYRATAKMKNADEVIQRKLDPVAAETARAVEAGALQRVQRQSGLTARGIRMERTHDGTGWVVMSTRNPLPGLPRWLEFGTSHARKFPYLYNSATLEAASYRRRAAEALADAIGELNG